MKRKVVIEIISGLLAFLFAYAALSKLAGYASFTIQLSQSPFITNYAGIIVWLLPLTELCIAGLFVFNFSRLLALYASLFLLSLFTAYLIAMLNFSYYIPCACGGVLAGLSWRQHIILNAACLLLSSLAIWFESKEKRGTQILKINQ